MIRSMEQGLEPITIHHIINFREFSTGLGEQCSICIGISDEEGLPVAGIVYRPLTTPPTYALGALSQSGSHFTEFRLDMSPSPVQGLLTS